MGDRVIVEIVKVDPGRRSLDFKLLDDAPKKHGRPLIEATEPPPGQRPSKRRREDPTPPSNPARKRKRPL